jgi:antitoxin component YwqK of YwqJK toxin-antitoxin module
MAKSWYRNGELRAITNFSMGKLDGNNKFWHKNGTLMMICNYKKGKLIDENCWDINGREINCN